MLYTNHAVSSMWQGPCIMCLGHLICVMCAFVSCNLCNVLCAMCFAQSTMCYMPYIMCYGSCALCHVLCVMCFVSCALCHVLCVMHFVSCALCHVLCVMCFVSCALCHVLCVMCFVSCTLYHVLCAMYFVSCALCHVLCIMCFVPCTLCHVLCVMCFVSCALCHLFYVANKMSQQSVSQLLNLFVSVVDLQTWCVSLTPVLDSPAAISQISRDSRCDSCRRQATADRRRGRLLLRNSFINLENRYCIVQYCTVLYCTVLHCTDLGTNEYRSRCLGANIWSCWRLDRDSDCTWGSPV